VTLRAWTTSADLLDAARAAMAIFERLAVDDTIERAAAEVSMDLFKLLDRFARDVTAPGTDETGLRHAITGTFTKLESMRPKALAFQFVASPYTEIHSVFAGVSASLRLTGDTFIEGTSRAQVVGNAATGDVLSALLLNQTLPPAHSTKLPRDLAATFTPDGDAVPRMLQALQPALDTTLYTALKNLDVVPPPEIRVYRLSPAAVFGHNAQPKPLRFFRGAITEQGEWPIIEPRGAAVIGSFAHEQESIINLDQPYEDIAPGSWLLIESAATHLTDAGLQVVKVNAVTAGTGRAQYGVSAKTTRITLGAAQSPPTPTTTSLTGSNAAIWIHIAGRTHDDTEFEAIRRTKLHFQGERLEVVEAPITSPVGHCDAQNAAEIELDDVYDGLESGRWLIVSGERVIAGTSGVRGAELVMLAGVEQRRAPNDSRHTFLLIASGGLTYCYKRDTVTIYGNVVKATQGETRPREVLGGGDATKALQQFTLKQPPLTFVPAANPRGVSSTLVVRVNDVKWHERDSLADAGPADRAFMTQTDDESKTTVIFGSGEHGSRLPTGLENVVATYRSGIGKSGNVKADKITLLSSRPPGVKEVTNPLRASGGADRESRDQARANAPLGVTALDRLVSTQDYADFARTFAGIGKANAERLTTGHELALHVTIAGVDDIPIDKTSDVYRNLVKALREFGDPLLPLAVELRELLALVLSARVRVLPDYDWEFVAPAIRARLVDWFAFERRDLGQAVFLSEVITVIQRVAGVAWVDVDVLNAIAEPELSAPAALAQKLADLAAAGAPAPYVNAARGQLAIFVADAPDTIILNEVTREP
jgi:predicted phage baseplate assembly protein